MPARALGALALLGFITGGAVRRRIALITGAVLLGLAVSMAINAFEPLGREYMMRYYRYTRLWNMPESAQFAASVTGLVILAVMTWRNAVKDD